MSSPDIITLQNFSEKLPKWDPQAESQLYAVVDMGSNGIRFSITSLTLPKARLLTPVYATRAAISLFDALTPSEEGDLLFPPETITEVASALANFNQLAILHQVPRSHIMVFATEAMRRAANATKMLDAIAKATDGLGVQILEPAVETLFGAVMGSRSSLTQVHGALFLDLGGGSVQMTWVDTSLEDYAVKSAMAGKSMPFGAARLTRILNQGDPALHSSEVDNLGSMMAESYGNLCKSFPKLQAIRDAYERGEAASVDVYMCGGGFRGYGSMLMHHDATTPYPIPSIGTYTVDGASFKRTAELREANKTYDGRVFGLSRRRRQQFDAISTVVESFIAAVPNIRTVTFCKGSNRDGALMMLLPSEVRESNPLEILPDLGDHDKELSRTVVGKLTEAIPREVDLSNISTVLTNGLHALFVPQIWARAGFEADTNASYALHDAIARDSDAPGLTHVARATLGLTLAARWGLNFSPADAQLTEGLRSILSRQHTDAVFWSQYIGTIAKIIAFIFPTCPRDLASFDSSIRFESNIIKRPDKKDRIHLNIAIDPESLQMIDSTDVDDIVQSGLKNSKGKFQKKVQVQITSLS